MKIKFNQQNFLPWLNEDVWSFIKKRGSALQGYLNFLLERYGYRPRYDLISCLESLPAICIGCGGLKVLKNQNSYNNFCEDWSEEHLTNFGEEWRKFVASENLLDFSIKLNMVENSL